MKVLVHKGIELMTALMLVSDCDFVKKVPSAFDGNKAYIENIYKWFNHFKDDEIVSEFKILNFGFNVVAYGYILNDDYAIDESKDIVNISEPIKLFLLKLQEFARKVNFDNFIRENKELYQNGIKEYTDFLIKSDYENFMKWFYKLDFDKKIDNEFILLPSLFQVGMCLQNGKACCVSIQEKQDDKSYFVSKEMNENAIPHTALHEFSHPIIDALTRIYFENNENFNIDNEITKNKGIYQGEGVINDTIIEAIVCLYLKKKGTVAFAEKRIQSREKVGFYLIRPLIDFLNNYVNNIEQYESFGEFLPQVMTFLQEKSKNFDIEKFD